MNGLVKAFIPFRSGSTRLRDKNILPMSGIPLASWAFITALRSETIEEIVLSTDSVNYYEQILLGAEKFIKITKPVIFDKRRPENALATTKIFDYLQMGLSQKYVSDEDLLVQLLPTCPFRRRSTLDDAIRLFRTSGNNMFSATEYDFRVSFAFEVAESGYVSLFDNSPMLTGSTQSQSSKIYYHPCGSFNIVKMSDLRFAMKTIYTNCVPLIISREQGLDIDTKSDFDFMNHI